MSGDERATLKLAGHALEQAEKHAKMLTSNPGAEQFHLDSIALLLLDATKALGITRPPVAPIKGPEPSSEPDPELAWLQERARR